MTEAEIIELINKKRKELEELHSIGLLGGSPIKRALELEIKELEATLSFISKEEQVFLDECAG